MQNNLSIVSYTGGGSDEAGVVQIQNTDLSMLETTGSAISDVNSDAKGQLMAFLTDDTTIQVDNIGVSYYYTPTTFTCDQCAHHVVMDAF